jgi:2-hydroxy-6-oxonona-2,4-dienedioate hydrolase
VKHRPNAVACSNVSPSFVIARREATKQSRGRAAYFRNCVIVNARMALSGSASLSIEAARMNVLAVPVGPKPALENYQTAEKLHRLWTAKRRKDMPFIASNGLTEAGTSKTIAAGGMNVHYHDVGEGEPVLFLHSYGPGTTAWITFHKVVGALSQRFRCILMDLPNFSKTGPIVYREGVHAVQARTAVALLDALGIQQACWVGNSQGGQSAMVAAITYPERVAKFVMGGSHIGTGGDRYLMANRPSEGSRATRQALDDTSREKIRHYLRVHIDDESLVTDELVDYIHRAHTWSQEFIEARRQSVSLPHDYTQDLAGIQAPVLLIHGRYDRMVPFEISIAILNNIADSRLVLLNNCGHWPPFEKPAEWAAQVLAFLKGY